jgi:hypothetical protein
MDPKASRSPEYVVREINDSFRFWGDSAAGIFEGNMAIWMLIYDYVIWQDI